MEIKKWNCQNVYRPLRTPSHRAAGWRMWERITAMCRYIWWNGASAPEPSPWMSMRGPLARAEEHIRAEGLSDRIQTRKSDGLAALAPEETDAVVIAGMGGALMCRILQGRHRIFGGGQGTDPAAPSPNVQGAPSAVRQRIPHHSGVVSGRRRKILCGHKKPARPQGQTGRAERGPSRTSLRMILPAGTAPSFWTEETLF